MRKGTRSFYACHGDTADAENAMKAMVLNKLRERLEWTDFADRQPGPGEIQVKVSACGVCRTDLHVVDGELTNP